MLRRLLRRLRHRDQPVDRSRPPIIYPDDRFLVSYPRSGNTWLRYLVANLLAPDADWNETNLQGIVPDMYDRTFPQTDYPRPRYIKSHEPFMEEYPRVLMLYRDGRDVAASYHDFLRKVRGREFSFDEFLDELCEGKLAYGSWHEHIQSWMDREHRVPFLAIGYEDMCADTPAVLSRMASFLDMNVDAVTIQRAVQKCTFGWYQDNVRQFNPHAKAGWRGGVRGGPGKWREVFSESQLDRFWSVAGPTMERLGYARDPEPNTQTDTGSD
jgi:hypothetical protein